ncbi:CBS domain-containing protein [Niallia sp. 01092]|uniref:CBS domain-containing protein n=1 Tax=unclassified Niallia TaxID=2837522 RepID=UPI003FD46E8B
MNIAFFLIPKKDVVYLPFKSTMRQALEKMEYHRYTAIPLLTEEGKYAGTLTEGDLLWKLKHTPTLNFKNTERVNISEVPIHRVNQPITINAEIEDVFLRVLEQNFIPVLDDKEIFIVIIRRREVIDYLMKINKKIGNL